jgi:hypothetical protein
LPHFLIITKIYYFKLTDMIKKGTKVRWKWGNGFAEGKVAETYAEKVTKKIEGAEVTRHGESGNKALLIEQEDGAKVLKLEQEVEKS